MGYLPKSAKNISYLRSIGKGKYRLAVRRDYRVVYRIDEEQIILPGPIGFIPDHLLISKCTDTCKCRHSTDKRARDSKHQNRYATFL